MKKFENDPSYRLGIAIALIRGLTEEDAIKVSRKYYRERAKEFLEKEDRIRKQVLGE